MWPIVRIDVISSIHPLWAELTHTIAPQDSSQIEEAIEDGAGRYFGGHLSLEWIGYLNPIWKKIKFLVEFIVSLIDCFQFFVE